MNNSYIIRKATIQEVIDDATLFEKRIAKFQSLKPEYKYKLATKKSNQEGFKWELHVKIWKDEQVNNKVLRETINTSTVL